jgi:iron complex transport system permease protein
MMVEKWLAENRSVLAEAGQWKRSDRRRRRWMVSLLLIILMAAGLLSLSEGGYAISVPAIIGILLNTVGFETSLTFNATDVSVLLSIRIPRLLLAAFVGAALSLSGTVTQAVFRNPLADPAVIGVSGGAAAAATFAVIAGIASTSYWGLSLSAFIGALATTLLVYTLARRNGRTEVTTLILVGIAIDAVAGALVSLFQYMATQSQLQGIVFWLMGSASGATWPKLGLIVPLMTLGVIPLFLITRPLNLLVLGEAEAHHLGIATEKIRLLCIICTALVTGTAVAVAGIVPFVGLVAPHIMRMVVGPDHRTLIPASVLGGAILVMLADLIARTAVSPAQLPLGLVTAMIGGPFFLYLIERARREQGGWG